MKKNESYGDEEFSITHAQERMVDQLRIYGIKDIRILYSMQRIPRHRFIPVETYPLEYGGLEYVYGDHACEIGYGQTMSQPFIVAYMTELLKIQKGDRILEIGSGSGYQTAVLLSLGAEVYSIEIIPELAQFAASRLAEQGFKNFHLKEGDGWKDWAEFSPYQDIIVTCAPEVVPPELIKQLDEGGRMVLPVGRTIQHLVLLTKKENEISKIKNLCVRFVPMIHCN